METSAYFANLLDGVDVALCEYDAELRAVRWNARFLDFFPEHAGAIHVGESYADNLRRFYALRLPAEDMGQIERRIAEGISRHLHQFGPFEFTHHGRRLKASSLPRPDGSRARVWREVAPAQAARSGMPAFDMLENLAEGACVLGPDGAILASNDRFRRLYGVPAHVMLVGMTIEDVVAAAWDQKVLPAATAATIRNGLRYDSMPFEIELPGDRWIRIVVQHVEGGSGYVVHGDVTATRRQHHELLAMRDALQAANSELARLAAQDPLTGLLNGRAFREAAATVAGPCAMLAIDADHFKAINDRHGHQAGDECLRRLGAVIGGIATRVGGVAARLGGEEFALLIGNVGEARARAIAEELHRAIAAPVPGLPGMTVSIGIACGSGDPESLYAAADKALYGAKRGGRNQTMVASTIAA